MTGEEHAARSALGGVMAHVDRPRDVVMRLEVLQHAAERRARVLRRARSLAVDRLRPRRAFERRPALSEEDLLVTVRRLLTDHPGISATVIARSLPRRTQDVFEAVAYVRRTDRSDVLATPAAPEAPQTPVDACRGCRSSPA